MAKLIGYAMLVLSLPALLSLWSVPQVRGALPAGGLLGTVLSAGLLAAFNSVGAHLVAACAFLTGLLLATPFSFSGTHAVLRGPMEKLSPMARLRARWSLWREAQHEKRLKKRMETTKTKGRQPAPPQTIAAMESRKTALEEESDAADSDATPEAERYEPVLIASQTPAASERKKAATEPKIAKGTTSFRLPSTGLLHLSERSERIQEDELKECARSIEQKCKEFDVGGHVTQINPGPVVTTYEFKPEAGIKYSRITGLAEDLCLALQAESILIERIPGKSTIGIEVPNQHRQTISLREVIESPEFANSSSKLTLALRQGLDRAHARFRSGADAAPADCRLHRHGQERLSQFADRLHAVQGHAGRGEAGDGRSQAAGAGTVRGHSAPAGAGGDRSQGGLERPAQRHARDGAPAEAAGAARRAQHRSVQPHVQDRAVALAV